MCNWHQARVMHGSRSVTALLLYHLAVIWCMCVQASPAELLQLIPVFDDRDEAIRRGMTIEGIRYEVHRYCMQPATSGLQAVHAPLMHN